METNLLNSSNDILNRHTLNRNFERLLRNDLYLDNLLNQIYYNNIAIFGYNSTKKYSVGDMVWFFDGESLYLLRSLFNNNSTRPVREKIGNNWTFKNSGWSDMYEFRSLFDNDLLVQSFTDGKSDLAKYIINFFNHKIEADHALDSRYHKNGKLIGTTEYCDTKLLRTDLQNINHQRKTNFYPYQTLILQSTNSIIGGYCRKWDNGFLEYNIFFQLGYNGVTVHEKNSDYMVIAANTLELNDSKYYTGEAKTIFKQPGEDSVFINNMKIVNLNKTCNSFSARLNFPVEFKDTKYSIFGTNFMCNENDTSRQSVDSSKNVVTYTNKTNSSIDAVLVIYPDNDETYSGIVINTFHCQIFGRWG